MNGDREDVPWTGCIIVPSPYYPYYAYERSRARSTSPTLRTSRTAARFGWAPIPPASRSPAPRRSDQGLHLFNTGTIDATSGLRARPSALNADNSLDSYAVNVGTIVGNITFGAGDDRLMNTLMIDNAGRVTHSGNIVMNGSVIDFGAGENRFDNDRGMITIAGGDNLISGADLFMTQASIEARNNAVDSSLTIDGNLSGDFMFGADFNGGGSDQLIITGDVADGSSMSVVLNPTEQLSGETSFTVITVGGENNAGRAHHRGRDRRLRRQRAGRRGELLRGDGRGHRDGALRHGTHGDVRVVSDHAWRSTGGCSRSAASTSATCSSSRAWKIPACRCGPTYSRKKARSIPATICRTSASIRSSPVCRPASSGRATSAAARFSVGPMFSYGNASANQNANLAEREGRRFGLRPQRRLSVRQRPVPERDLAADGDGDRLPDAGHVVERDRQRPTPTAMASMSSWATRTS